MTVDATMAMNAAVAVNFMLDKTQIQSFEMLKQQQNCAINGKMCLQINMPSERVISCSLFTSW